MGRDRSVGSVVVTRRCAAERRNEVFGTPHECDDTVVGRKRGCRYHPRCGLAQRDDLEVGERIVTSIERESVKAGATFVEETAPASKR